MQFYLIPQNKAMYQPKQKGNDLDDYFGGGGRGNRNQNNRQRPQTSGYQEKRANQNNQYREKDSGSGQYQPKGTTYQQPQYNQQPQQYEYQQYYTQPAYQESSNYSQSTGYYDDDLLDYGYDKYSDEEYSQEDDYQETYEERYDDDPEPNRSGTLKVVMVAEKNSIAEAITKALTQNFRKNKGRNAAFYFTSQFRGQKANFVVTATNGHVFNRDFPKEYSDWESVDPLKLFRAQTIKKPTPKSGTVRALQGAAKDADYLLLWLDNDREGENICFEVIDVCSPYMRKNYKALRAKFSSITAPEIRQAYQSINSPPNQKESESVDARQIIDLIVGVAFSRFQTMYFTKKYPQLKDRLITFGPCQTPTLGFCVSRHEEIQNFKPQTYYYLTATLQNTSGYSVQAEYQGDKIWQEKEAKDLATKLRAFDYFDVIEAKSTEKTKPRPIGINTVALLKFASSYLGIGPQQAMHMAERLYLQGYISYPRTESTAYPKGFNTDQIIDQLQQYPSSEVKNHVSKLKQYGRSQPRGGVDVGDHPPITPTITVPKGLSGGEKGMYEYIVKMFLASHTNDIVYKHSKLRCQAPGYKPVFKLSGNKVVDPGFSAIATWLGIADNNLDVQKFVQNNKVAVANVEYKFGQTTPPDYLTESDLIGLMQSNGIGTDASMATHINNVIERNYVKVEQGARRLIPTELGICLVKGYKKIDPELVAPQLRSNIESKCLQIARGQAKFRDVVDDVLDVFETKYKNFKAKINLMDEIFGPKKDLFASQISAPKGGKRGKGGRGGPRKPKDDEFAGPSQKASEVTIGDFLGAMLTQKGSQQAYAVNALHAVEAQQQAQQKGQTTTELPKKNQANVKKEGKRDFKSKRDGDLLY